jgi:hypothetical protein
VFSAFLSFIVVVLPVNAGVCTSLAGVRIFS